LVDSVRLLSKMGFDGVELMGDLMACDASELAHVLNDHELRVFSLTPANVDVAHPDPAVRSEAVTYYSRLLDFAAELGAPTVSCHGYVGRVRAVSSQTHEWDLLVAAVREIAQYARKLGLQLAMEALNRYESHLLNTADQVQTFLSQVEANNVGILLDAYHMNIEEPDPAAALRQAGNRLLLYHAADSNRKGIGRGHTDFGAQVAALKDINYGGPVILECTAPGPDPFGVSMTEDSFRWLQTYLRESRDWLHRAFR
jgi:D-psicose/D-tagatose/L-ribulose 3-epimerase